MQQIYVKIDGMHCSHCEDTIQKELLKISSVEKVEFDGFIACIFYNGKIDKKKIIQSITSKGYITKMEYISENKEDLKSNIKLKEFIVIAFSIIFIVLLINKIFGFRIWNAIPTIDSSITYGMLFVTGVLTSIHCISMCGAINLMAVMNHSTNRNIKRPLLYNLGRVLSYALIGGIVGLIGSIFSINRIISGMIILLAAIFMLLVSLNMLGIIKLKKIPFFKYKTNTRNPFVIGLLNGLMPCGPLQAMQVYALSTGSFIKGALSMLLFGLGTVPLMLFAGILLNLVKGKGRILINKIAAVLILLLSFVMLNRGLLALNIDIFKPLNQEQYMTSTLEEDYQVIEFDLSYDNYQDMIVQKDIPVKMIIHVDKKHLTGCNHELIINAFHIKQELKEGENVIEFTPTKEETITYTCSMNMIKNTIKVIDDETYFKGE
jgi:sulfite exporter TauE/SafE/copper chaperone CopZ